jgi:hypothetical protein
LEWYHYTKLLSDEGGGAAAGKVDDDDNNNLGFHVLVITHLKSL